MRVCILTTSYPRWPGDFGGFFVESIASQLVARHGWQVRVVAPHAHGLSPREVRGGVEIRRFRYAWPDRLESLCYGAGMVAALKSNPLRFALLPFLGLGGALAAGAASEGCDVVHCMWTITGPAGLRAGRRRGIPVVITTLGSDMDLAKESGILRRLNHSCIRRCSAVTSSSPHQRDAARAIAGPDKIVEYIPNGVDDAFLGPLGGRAKTVDVLFVGRLAQEKRPELLMEALVKLAARGKKVSARFVGDGPLKPMLQEQIVRHGLTSVELVGAVPHSQVAAEMDQARVLALVSAHEGLPNVLVEAMARGLATVACDVGSIACVVQPGQTGVLLDRETSADALADALDKLLSDAQAIASLGHAGREFVTREYSWEKAVGQYDQLYRRLIGEARP